MALPLIGASLLGGALNFAGQSSANAANEAIAQKQMDFQERMSDTQYERGVADMRKAGLNPILAAGGMQTSSPTGAALPVQNAMGGAVSSAMQAIDMMNNLKFTNARLQNVAADTLSKIASAKNTDKNTELTDQDVQVQASARQKQAMTDEATNRATYYEGMSESVAKDIAMKSMENKVMSDTLGSQTGAFGNVMSYIRSILSAVGMGSSSAQQLFGGRFPTIEVP